MKNIKKRWLGLVIAPALLALIGFASPAQANDYGGTCAGYPGNFDGTGNVNINNTGACTISVPVSAQGFVHITSSGAVNTQDVTAGTDLNITTSSGAITTLGLTTSSGDLKIDSATNITVTGTIDSYGSIQANANNGKIAVSSTVTSNLGGNGANILLVATGNVRTGSISTNGGTTTGGVEIHANTNANGTLFNIGTATTNGVNGTINTSNSTAGGMITDFVVGGIFITNGNANSTAGIKVISAANINVTASASRSGIIYLDARKGTLTLPTGALSSTGPNGQPAGWIVLMAGTLKTVNNTVITASQTTTALSTNHGVIVAASSITVAGSGGLKINGDGNGITGSFPTAYAQVIPTGGISVTSTAFDSNNVNSMLWTPSSITSSTNAPVTVSGTGAFTLTSNGNYARAAVYAYPITFSNAAVTISSKGTTNHQVELVYSGAMTGGNGLTMSGTGAVTLDASGSSGNDPGGTVYVLVDQATINATVPSLTIKADGKGTGTGGNVTFQPTKVVSLAAPTVNMSANNGKSTSGAGVVNFQPNGGNGTAAITSTTFNLTANGPTTGSGDAGVIYFSTSALTQGSTTKSIFSAKGAAAGMGKGGFITVFPGAIADYKLGTNPGNVQVIADGGLTGGDAGRINVNPFPGSLTIDTANAVSAKALGGNAKGGFIQLVGNPNLAVNPTLTGATINVDGKGTGAAGEIHIFANGTVNLGSTAGSLLLSANGDPAGTGDGGIIELGYITTLNITDLSASAGAGSSSNGKGGTINIHDGGTYTITGTVKADGKGTGDAGNITISSLFANIMTLNGARISASADTNGSGSGKNITVLNAGEILMNGTVVDANGAGTGAGGTIQIEVTSANSPKLDLNGIGTFVNAIGGPDGLGGKFISGNIANFRAPEVVTVRAGDNSSVSDFDGSMTLNLVLCQQWKTSYAPSFPGSYWNCAHPTAPDANDEIHIEQAGGLISSLRAELKSPSTHLFVFDDAIAYRRFFTETVQNVPDDALGYTTTFDGPIIFASLFRNFIGSTGYTAATAVELTEASSHELTHAIDFRKGFHSTTASWSNFAKNDFLNLDYSTVGSSSATSTKRLACSTNNSAPLDGVIDASSNSTFCDPLNPGHLKASYTVGGVIPSNSKLLLNAEPDIFGLTNGGFYFELYAQSGTYEYYSHLLPPSLYLKPTSDGVFARGYFPCVRSWSSAVLAGAFTPPASPASCSSLAPVWYVPHQ